MTSKKLLLQKAVQKIATLIDFDMPCLVTGRTRNNVGGHIFGKGAHPECRFNLHNIHRQDFFSNGSGQDDQKMKDGIKREYGENYYNRIVDLANKPIPKLSEKDYESAYKSALIVIDAYSTIRVRQTTGSRILLRERVNKMIGIYE